MVNLTRASIALRAFVSSCLSLGTIMREADYRMQPINDLMSEKPLPDGDDVWGCPWHMTFVYPQYPDGSRGDPYRRCKLPVNIQIPKLELEEPEGGFIVRPDFMEPELIKFGCLTYRIGPYIDHNTVSYV